MEKKVSDYVANAPEAQRLIMEMLLDIIREEIPNVKISFKWGRPVFSTESDLAYFKTGKAYFTFGFFKFNKIQNHLDLLEGTGKDMRHIKIKSAREIDPHIIKTWLKQLDA